MRSLPILARQNSVRAIAMLLVAVLPLAAAAQRIPRDSAADSIDFEERSREAGELELKLPPPPKPESLIAFDTGPRGGLAYFVDAASLSVGSDGIVRFTVVAKGDGNAQNVFYEGIRCQTRERKVFAYGQSDGTWKEARNPTWTKIGPPVEAGYRFVLYQDFFCPARAIVRSAAEAAYALRRGGHPRLQEDSRSNPLPR
jgi:hypothetical protein